MTDDKKQLTKEQLRAIDLLIEHGLDNPKSMKTLAATVEGIRAVGTLKGWLLNISIIIVSLTAIGGAVIWIKTWLRSM